MHPALCNSRITVQPPREQIKASPRRKESARERANRRRERPLPRLHRPGHFRSEKRAPAARALLFIAVPRAATFAPVEKMQRSPRTTSRVPAVYTCIRVHVRAISRIFIDFTRAASAAPRLSLFAPSLRCKSSGVDFGEIGAPPHAIRMNNL